MYLNEEEAKALRSLEKWVASEWEAEQGLERPELIRRAVKHAVSLHGGLNGCPRCKEREEKERARVLEELSGL